MLRMHCCNARHTPSAFALPTSDFAAPPHACPLKSIDLVTLISSSSTSAVDSKKMAAVAARASCSLVASTGAVASPQAVKRTSTKAGARKLNLFGGLKAENKVMALGLSSSTEQKFASLAASCSARSRTTCNVGEEILTIVPIMSGLVLAGIAIGFVLLRVEAAVEESE